MNDDLRGEYRHEISRLRRMRKIMLVITALNLGVAYMNLVTWWVRL